MIRPAPPLEARPDPDAPAQRVARCQFCGGVAGVLDWHKGPPGLAVLIFCPLCLRGSARLARGGRYQILRGPSLEAYDAGEAAGGRTEHQPGQRER